MSFQDAARNTLAVREHLRPGLQAVENVDRDRLRCSKPRRLRGSVSLERALPPGQPNEPRWDYAIGLVSSPNDTVVWLEVHPASSTGNVGEVLRKLGWLKTWIAQDAPALSQLRRHFVWLATGRVSFHSGSPQMKTAAQSGLLFRARQLNLDRF